MGKSQRGAQSVTVHFRQADGNMTHRETFYVTSGEQKGCKPYYLKDGKKIMLPGYEMMDNLSMLAAGKRLAQLNAEDKVIKLWSYQEKKEVPTNVPVLTELLGKAVRVGLTLNEENRRKKVGDEYVDTNEKREFNEVNKLFHAKGGLTVAEAQAGETEGGFIKEWEERYPADYVRSTFTPVAEDTTSVVDAASAAATEAAAEDQAGLFD